MKSRFNTNDALRGSSPTNPAENQQQHQREIAALSIGFRRMTYRLDTLPSVKLEVRLGDEAVQHSRAIRVGTGNPSLIV